MNKIDFLHLELHEKVGEGCFGNVWKASYLGTPVAVKECVPSNDEKDAEFLAYFEREVDMLSKSRHPNIVQFLGTCIHDKKFWIVTEYIPCGTMKSWIISGKAVSFKTRLSFAIDIARALTYLHSCNIIHRDLKPSNLLITENKRVKMCDFGFARLLCRTAEERKRMSYCGTDEYMAPEILQGLPFDESVDVFGFGIILCELASCQVANSRVFCREIPGYCVRSDEVRTRATSDCPYQLLDLALRCINGDPAMRPTMGEALGELHALENFRSSLATPVSFASSNSKSTQPLSNLPPLMAIQIPDSNISFRLEKEAISFIDSPSSEPSTSSVELKSPQSTCTNIPPIHTFKSLLAGDSKDFMGSIGRAAVPKVDATLSMASFASIDSLRRSHEGLGSRRPVTLMLESSKGGGHGHRFSIREANSHETCLHCHHRLSDFLASTYAMACEDCGFLCHKRCAPLTPLNCEAPSPALKALASLFNSQPFFLSVDNPPSTI